MKTMSKMKKKISIKVLMYNKIISCSGKSRERKIKGHSRRWSLRRTLRSSLKSKRHYWKIYSLSKNSKYSVRLKRKSLKLSVRRVCLKDFVSIYG